MIREEIDRMSVDQPVILDRAIDELYRERACYLQRLAELSGDDGKRVEFDGYVSLIQQINAALVRLSSRARAHRMSHAI